MAGEALLVDGGAMLPEGFPQDIFMAGKAEGLGFIVEIFRKLDLFRVMALGAAFRDHLIAMEKINALVV